MPVLAVVEDPLVRASLLSDVGPAEDALLNDLFFGGMKILCIPSFAFFT